MDIQNKRISDGEFEALRREVLAQWPTGDRKSTRLNSSHR